MQPLRDGAHGADELVLLDSEVGAERRGGGVAGQEHQRRTALGGFGQGGQRIGEPRTLVHGAQADPAGCLREGIGHRHRAALVAGRDELHAFLDQCIRHGEIAAADQSEDVRRSAAAERAAHGLTDEHR